MKVNKSINIDLQWIVPDLLKSGIIDLVNTEESDQSMPKKHLALTEKGKFILEYLSKIYKEK